MVYVFDNNAFRVLQNYYPQRFPSLWQQFGELLATGDVISTREVWRELEMFNAKSWFREWLNEHKTLFCVPGEDETEFVSKILSVPHFQTLVGKRQILKGSPVADPWIIACAHVRGGTVVTEESHKPNAAKIPNVCEHFNIPWINLEGFMDAMRWTF
jgi:hypothetical protein